MCKGRIFAEKEVIRFSAAILAAWNIQPMDGEWKYPGESKGTGATHPLKNIRVRIARRLL